MRKPPRACERLRSPSIATRPGASRLWLEVLGGSVDVPSRWPTGASCRPGSECSISFVYKHDSEVQLDCAASACARNKVGVLLVKRRSDDPGLASQLR